MLAKSKKPIQSKEYFFALKKIRRHLKPFAKSVLLTLKHVFEVKDIVDGIVEKINTTEEALQCMHRSIENNSNKELASIKQILETNPCSK